MKNKAGETAKRRMDLELEVLAHLKMRSLTHRTMLHSRFDLNMTGILNLVLLDLEERGLIERGPDNMLNISASGLAHLLKYPR